ncbi:hypothetical protein BU16DRAFT_541370 [Lophium mytilinum]|uniref:Uncharacterized protein n=1 Tax=Lophium mytilinum TaxID=390894 RepID=A0A6A6QKQ0_9PEZI|nr:hypothetical protein BU16DRAFT_541370 [Lophium mytilinum]
MFFFNPTQNPLPSPLMPLPSTLMFASTPEERDQIEREVASMGTETLPEWSDIIRARYRQLCQDLMTRGTPLPLSRVEISKAFHWCTLEEAKQEPRLRARLRQLKAEHEKAHMREQTKMITAQHPAQPSKKAKKGREMDKPFWATYLVLLVLCLVMLDRVFGFKPFGKITKDGFEV